ncbi:MAG: DUF1269 domain-containing protein [Bauldia sp.]|nr:MAG: DUF1269 domain-containing protein [Bauldia sp.]
MQRTVFCFLRACQGALSGGAAGAGASRCRAPRWAAIAHPARARLIGLLGRPVGLPIGAAIGGLTGLLFDLDRSGISVTFVDDVSKVLTPGKPAVIADMDEASAAQDVFQLASRMSARNQSASAPKGDSKASPRSWSMLHFLRAPSTPNRLIAVTLLTSLPGRLPISSTTVVTSATSSMIW